MQDHFARYPAHGLLSTTHLILKNPTGDKFFSAKKWNIPAVADRWGRGRGGRGGGVEEEEGKGLLYYDYFQLVV